MKSKVVLLSLVTGIFLCRCSKDYRVEVEDILNNKYPDSEFTFLSVEDGIYKFEDEDGLKFEADIKYVQTDEIRCSDNYISQVLLSQGYLDDIEDIVDDYGYDFDLDDTYYSIVVDCGDITNKENRNNLSEMISEISECYELPFDIEYYNMKDVPERLENYASYSDQWGTIYLDLQFEDYNYYNYQETMGYFNFKESVDEYDFYDTLTSICVSVKESDLIARALEPDFYESILEGDCDSRDDELNYMQSVGLIRNLAHDEDDSEIIDVVNKGVVDNYMKLRILFDSGDCVDYYASISENAEHYYYKGYFD